MWIQKLVLVVLLVSAALSFGEARAESPATVMEQAMSDTLDLWREGRYEQLYEQLAHRGRTSKEQFVERMRDAAVRPACCHNKLNSFKVLNEKRTEATVYAKVGLEGTPNVSESVTREFKLTHEENSWKMQLADVFSISGVTGKKKKHTAHRKNSPYK